MKADILIQNGRVIDPYDGTDEIRSVAMAGGVLIDPAGVTDAEQIVDASGCIVTPGLIDLHAHVASAVSEIAVHPEAACFPTGVTTAVDPGTTGIANYPAFRAQSAACGVHLRALLHCSVGGISTIRTHEDHDPAHFDEAGMLRCLRENKDRLFGVKVRVSRDVVGAHGLEPLLRAREIAEKAGVLLGCHVTGAPVLADELASYFRPGDLFIHAFHGTGHTILGENGHVLPGVWDAKRRGVLFDVSCGRTHFCFSTARRALAEGFLPDIIGTDLIRASAWRHGKCFSLPYQMSKYLALGMTLPQVVACVTTNPARAMGEERELGSLQPGTAADVAVHLPLRREERFIDAAEESLTGQTLLKTQMTVRAGEVVYRQIDF